MIYDKYDDWMNEVEGVGTRFERFLDEWDAGMSVERMQQWLRAAWECSREGPKEEIAMLRWMMTEHD